MKTVCVYLNPAQASAIIFPLHESPWRMSIDPAGVDVTRFLPKISRDLLGSLPGWQCVEGFQDEHPFENVRMLLQSLVIEFQFLNHLVSALFAGLDLEKRKFHAQLVHDFTDQKLIDTVFSTLVMHCRIPDTFSFDPEIVGLLPLNVQTLVSTLKQRRVLN